MNRRSALGWGIVASVGVAVIGTGFFVAGEYVDFKDNVNVCIICGQAPAPNPRGPNMALAGAVVASAALVAMVVVIVLRVSTGNRLHALDADAPPAPEAPHGGAAPTSRAPAQPPLALQYTLATF